ncbi:MULTISPECIES: tRNA epoxyqueuosine(34) reductase QueG [Microcystis]|uniref:Epoxyqueuosine reductase n=1 Tax=Microcystis viridis FACHB-1342 TaxID=2692900 RepID=A0ABR8G9X5_MICVR|nr:MULTISPECIES: tRNA epoxyqueuosine(34) reductase QueG [Microcystis]MBD2600122.1 tRNA epoxyqueuosine(34) reductase QueG [Microcystis viridis FACHB-1342]MCA2625279.1 tRNA epoxyqueuosine(34) reductase QueG [Microcystis sp. M19BS1]MCA2632544.1 tRNA epoxyqueuosine(34) reductase QueG [Microcystis sp. M20BS1]MDB9388631.1 tRNA epoxyqueuosine(34) reductase QueG [Microcystis aeruginosa CS-583]ODV36757.1 Epoxyqueuosine (oQ) reductase QueG [Microcystis aeruginosa NIES-98]
MVTETQIKEKALELGFHGVGIASVDSQDSAVSHLKSWLERGYQADMDWMTNPKRQDIKTLWPEVRSLICLALNYYTPQQHSQEQNHGKISRYAWGRDYHKVLSKKLKALSQWLESQGEQIQTRYYVDTGPVQDKVWAQRAGIGWIAKNGNLITRNYGSWVFLGEILTNLPLEPDRPHSAHCGTCSRCLSACPTQAIVSPSVVDANRCIAYHTIENRAVTLPTEIAKNLQGWVAGCDICQDVCPWNQRFAQVTDVEDFQPRPENLSPKLEELANLTIEEWDRRFISSALRRIKPQQWRRNAQANLAHSPHPPQDDN